MNKNPSLHDIWSMIHNSCGESISKQVNDRMLSNIKAYLTLTDSEREYLTYIRDNKQLLRHFMDKEEISKVNKLVKFGFITKGISDDKQKSVIYLLNE